MVSFGVRLGLGLEFTLKLTLITNSNTNSSTNPNTNTSPNPKRQTCPEVCHVHVFMIIITSKGIIIILLSGRASLWQAVEILRAHVLYVSDSAGKLKSTAVTKIIAWSYSPCDRKL